MNPDCWIHVFSFLDIGSKMRCESVSRSFHQMIQSSLSRQETIQTKEKKSSHLQGMDNVPDALVNNHALRPSLQALLSKCINLKSISITTTTSNSPDDIIIVVTEHCRKLERLEIRCPNIRVTWAGSVFEKQMQHAWQEMLTKLPHLKSLSLPFCSSHRLSQLLSARDMHEIDLSIYNEPVSEEHLQCVCRNLTKFSGSIIMTESAVVKLMGSCPNLKVLSSGPMSNAILAMIAFNMTQLSSLSFCLVRAFSVESMPNFSHFTNLQRLDIQTFSFKHFDGAFLSILRQAGQRLQSVTLQGFLVTDLSLSFVSLLAPKLQDLRIKRSIFMPELEIPGITDDSFKSFAKFLHARSIDIDTPNCVSHTGIAYLLTHTASKEIRYLRIWDATKPALSPAVLQAAASYCKQNANGDVITVCLDHQNSIGQDDVHVVEAQHQANVDKMARSVRVMLSLFDKVRDQNLHLTVRIGSQCLVYH